MLATLMRKAARLILRSMVSASLLPRLASSYAPRNTCSKCLCPLPCSSPNMHCQVRILFSCFDSSEVGNTAFLFDKQANCLLENKHERVLGMKLNMGCHSKAAAQKGVMPNIRNMDTVTNFKTEQEMLFLLFLVWHLFYSQISLFLQCIPAGRNSRRRWQESIGRGHLLGQIQSFFVGHAIFNLVIFVVVSCSQDSTLVRYWKFNNMTKRTRAGRRRHNEYFSPLSSSAKHDPRTSATVSTDQIPM
jgi:hypothetical protein